MNKEELIPLSEKLNAEPDKKKRNDIAADFCKEKGVKPGEVWKQLKEFGLEPKSPPNEQNNNGQSDNQPGNVQAPQKEEVILASHKTAYEKYRCAGLVLTKKPENYLVTAEQLGKLRRDPWVVLEGKKTE